MKRLLPALSAALPLLSVAIVYVAYGLTLNSFFFCKSGGCESIPDHIWQVLKVEPPAAAASDEQDNPAGKDLKNRQSASFRYAGRMTWYFLGMVYAFVCVAALVTAIHTASRHFDWRIVIFVGTTITTLVFVLFYRHQMVHMAVFLTLFQHVITTDMPNIVQITNVLNSFGNAAAFALVLASCSAMLPSLDRSYPEGAKQLSVQAGQLRIVLYVGTLLLVTAMLLKKSIFQWSLAFTSQEEQAAKAAATFVSSLMAVEAGFYTLVLAAVYLPAAAFLQWRAYRLVDLPPESPAKDKVLAEYGLTFSTMEALPRILAILSPVLAGPIGELLGRRF